RYLGVRFPGNRFPTELADLIHARTGGNPLFMVNAVDYLVAEGLIATQRERWELVVEIENVELGVPDSIRQMIDKQVDHLDVAHQRIPAAAGVAGAEFSPLAVASDGDEDGGALEARRDELARRGRFLQDCGLHGPQNGEVAGRFGFIPALYQTVLYERGPA